MEIQSGLENPWGTYLNLANNLSKVVLGAFA